MASVKTEEYHLLDGRTIRCRYDRLGMAKISRENMESFVKEFNASYRQAKILEKIKENYAIMKLDERKKGKWIPRKAKYDNSVPVYECSICHKNNGFSTDNFCPNCGAEMESEE